MTIRLTGLVSGLDTDSLISSLMDVERVPILRLESDIYEQEDKLAAWDQVDTDLSALRSITDTLTSYSTWQQMSAESSDEDAVTASADSSADEETYNIKVTQLAQSHKIASDSLGAALGKAVDEALGLTGDFTLGGETITVAADDTLQDLRDMINTASLDMDDDEKVTASIIDDTLVFKRSATGDTDISIADGAANVLETLGIVEADGTTPKNEIQTSEDLAMTIDGVAVTRSQNTNLTDVLEGVTLNIHEETTGDGIELEVSHDTDTIKSLIQDFVEAYNTAMGTVGEANTVDMSENGDDIDALGLLQGDLLISEIGSRSRSLVTARDTEGFLDEAFNSLRDIGIWTSGRDNEISIVDSAALDEALANNFADVEDLFRDWDAGIMRGLDDYLNDLTSAVDGRITRRQQALENSISTKYDDIDNMERLLEAREEQLYEQFAAMESAMSTLQSSGNYVLNSLGNTSSS